MTREEWFAATRALRKAADYHRGARDNHPSPDVACFHNKRLRVYEEAREVLLEDLEDGVLK